MPCWKWENLNENIARIYASRHSRLSVPGQMSLWDRDRSKLTNLVNKSQQLPTPINKYRRKTSA